MKYTVTIQNDIHGNADVTIPKLNNIFGEYYSKPEAIESIYKYFNDTWGNRKFKQEGDELIFNYILVDENGDEVKLPDDVWGRYIINITEK